MLAAVGSVQDGDAVVTFNFRADRMVELSQVQACGWVAALVPWRRPLCNHYAS